MRVIIPTRNRPTSLSGVVRYYEEFYPETEIIVADGSSDGYQQVNAETAARSTISVDYRAYDPEISLFDRLLQVLRTESDPYFVMAADDDYPILETMQKARIRLDRDPDAVCAGGFLVHVGVRPPDVANARLDPVRHLVAPTAGRRMQVFGQLPFTTTYAVARRERLLARYEFLKHWNVPGFLDLAVGLMDVADGKFLAVPDLGFICTRNTVHSYYRASDHLIYLRRASEVLELYHMLTRKLMEVDGMGEKDARGLIAGIINRRVAALAGAPPFLIAGFTERAPYRTELIDRTRQRFADLFTAGTSMRKTHERRLSFIAKGLQATLDSNDDAGAESKYETL